MTYSDPKAIHTTATEYTWEYVNKTTLDLSDFNTTNHTIRTNVTLDDFGQVQMPGAQAIDFTIKGNSVINGSVYGGGNAAAVQGNVSLKLLDNTTVHGSVFGGGKTAKVNGNVNVQIGNGAGE